LSNTNLSSSTSNSAHYFTNRYTTAVKLTINDEPFLISKSDPSAIFCLSDAISATTFNRKYETEKDRQKKIAQ